MRLSFSILIAVVHAVIASVVCTKANNNRLSFQDGSTTVDFDVHVEAYSPQGLKVFILHKAGLELFTFHGRIKTSKGEYGEHFAQDITENTNGQWVFEDSMRMLRVGDTLHFWIFVQYKGTGHRFNHLVYNVMNLTPGPTNILPHQDIPITDPIQPTTPSRKPRNTSRKPEDATDFTFNKDTLADMLAKINTTADKVHILEESIYPLKDEIQSLTEITDELVHMKNVGTSLLLVTGTLPAQTNAVQYTRLFLIEKLNWKELSSSIIQAKYECGKIAFEVRSSVDKLRILRLSRDILSKLEYRIKDPNRSKGTEAEDTCNDYIQIDTRFSED